jgi:hypothetical protein
MRNSEIRASIVVPAYYAELYLRRSIGSALARTERRCEILVIAIPSS